MKYIGFRQDVRSQAHCRNHRHGIAVGYLWSTSIKTIPSGEKSNVVANLEMELPNRYADYGDIVDKNGKRHQL